MNLIPKLDDQKVFNDIDYAISMMTLTLTSPEDGALCLKDGLVFTH